MIKALKKQRIKGTYLKLIKAIYDKTTTNIIINRKKLKYMRQWCLLSLLSRQKNGVKTLIIPLETLRFDSLLAM
jgi:hypothetical protein